MRLLKILLVFVLIHSQLATHAQNFIVSGRIVDPQSNPISYAVVADERLFLGTSSDDEGNFSLLLPAGETSLKISYIGFKEQKIVVSPLLPHEDLVIVLRPETLMIDDIVVTGKQVKSRNGTSAYRIDNQAIRQIQAMSLGDILTLLPGKKLGSTTYGDVQQADLRSASSSVINNVGTAVILNGMTMNNDANMQTSNPVDKIFERFSSYGRGLDLRSISAAGIESVEVISGVASAKYGNLSSGAIIVKNKAGVLPLTVSANATASTYQVGLSQGFQLGEKGGILNAEVAYTYSSENPILRKNYYQNVSAGIRWTKMLNKRLEWQNTVSLQTNMGFNGQRYEPDEKVRNQEKVQNENVMLNIYGNFKVNNFGTFDYSLNTNIDHQYSHYKFYGTGPLPLLESVETGTWVTGYSPILFKQEQIMEGLPVNFSGHFEMKNLLTKKLWRFNFLTGVQFSCDKNFGKGRSVMGNVVQPSGSIGSRNAKFHEVPAAVTLSAYHELSIAHRGQSMTTDMRLGLRYDYMNQRYHLASPRLAGSLTFFDKWTLRAAWGLAYKAPTMLQLYPGPAYFDFINMSYLSPNPDERLAVVSTHVYQPRNFNLKPSHTNTFEIGTDWVSKGLTVRLTAFHKELNNGITLTPELMVLPLQNYEVVDAPTGVPPTVAPIEGDVDLILKKKLVMRNSLKEVTDGVELTLIPQKIRATNTEFNFQGSWMRTKRTDNSPMIELSKFIVGEGTARYGVYERVQRTTYLASGRLAVIQHFPRIGLIFTLNAELNFVDYESPRGGSRYPYAYYDEKGDFHPISTQMSHSEEFKDLVLNESLFEINDKKPFYGNLHLQVRKETRSGHSFSLYMTNFLWLNPTYVYKGIRRTLNETVEFGFGMSFKIGGGRK